MNIKKQLENYTATKARIKSLEEKLKKAVEDNDLIEKLKNEVELLKEKHRIEELYVDLSVLKQEQRKLIDMYYFKNFSYRDIGVIIHKSSSTVRRKLKKIIEELETY